LQLAIYKQLPPVYTGKIPHARPHFPQINST